MAQALVITGGIGSGKSSVSGFLRDRGWEILDADRLGHVVLTEPEIVEIVAERWPSVVISGQVDRSALGAIVFAEPEELVSLEAITHPRIKDRIDHWLARGDGKKAVEISVLRLVAGVGSCVVVIDAADEVRLERIVRRGLDPILARRRQEVQPQRQGWLDVADYVISNAGGLGDLKEAVHLLGALLEQP